MSTGATFLFNGFFLPLINFLFFLKILIIFIMERYGTKRKVAMGPSVAKKMRSMQMQVYRNRPEMRTRTSSSAGVVAVDNLSQFNICRIGTGSEIDNRSGNKIRVFRIEVRGRMGTGMDAFILQKKTSSDPTIDSFTGDAGCFINDGDNTTKFTEWMHYRNLKDVNTAAPCKFSKSFKGGMLVHFTGSAGTSVVRNELSVVLVNRSAAAVSYDLSVRVWYTDA